MAKSSPSRSISPRPRCATDRAARRSDPADARRPGRRSASRRWTRPASTSRCCRRTTRRRTTSIPRRRRRLAARASNDFLHETDPRQPHPLRGLRHAAAARPEGRRPTNSSAASPGSASRRHGDGHEPGLFLDDKRFRPIFERAPKLDVPIYIHPSPMKPAIVEAYLQGSRRADAGLAARLRASRR